MSEGRSWVVANQYDVRKASPTAHYDVGSCYDCGTDLMWQTSWRKPPDVSVLCGLCARERLRRYGPRGGV